MKYFLLSLALGLSHFSCYAQIKLPNANENTATEPVTSLIDNGQYQAAFENLQQKKKTTSQDWFIYGIAAHRSGHLTEAEQAYRTILKGEPTSGRVRLELASVLADQQNWGESRRLLQNVRAENPPNQVIQNIDRFLALIGEQERKNKPTRVRASVGYLYDSNVNSGTTARDVMLFNLPFRLADDARKQSDSAYTFRLDIDHLKELSPDRYWQTNFSFNWVDYFNVDEFDTAHLSASSGPLIIDDNQTTVSIPITASAVALTGRSGFYSASVGLAPQIRSRVNEKITFNLNGRIAHRHYMDFSERDALENAISPGFDIQISDPLTLRLAATLGRDKSDLEIYSNDNWAFNASLLGSLGRRAAFTIYGSIGESLYKDIDPAFDVKRRSTDLTRGGNIQIAHPRFGVDTLIGISYTDSDSNLMLYEYERFQQSISIRKDF